MKTKQKEVKVSRAYPFLKATIGNMFRRRFYVSVEGRDIMRQYTPPYIILPNHVMYSDPFIIATLLPHPVSYVTSDTQFRSRFVRLLLNLVNAIPKTKFRSDLESVKHIMKTLKSGGVVGIYPEGRRNWDGHTMPLLYATAKLLRVLKVPVLIPIVKGGFLTEPRWGRRRRRGRVVIEFKHGFTTDDLKAMTVDEIFQRMTELLEYDEYDFLRESHFSIRSKRRAENLELALFICPECKSIAKMESRFGMFTCSECGYAVHFNQYGFFEKSPGPLHFDTVRDWNLWQLSYLKGLLGTSAAEGNVNPVFQDDRVWMLEGQRNRPFKKLHFGRLSMYGNRIELETKKGDVLTFPAGEVESINVQSGERLEFFYTGRLLRFHFGGGLVSAYKWLAAVLLLQGKFNVQPI